jgi:hypothetical protein
MNSPENEKAFDDELYRLELLHQKMKDEQEAWRKLLINLQKMKSQENNNA